MSDDRFKLSDPGSQKILEARDMFAEPAGTGFALVRDEDGAALFNIHVDVNNYELQRILSYGDKRFRLGQAYGRREVKLRLLNLIGAQPVAEGP